MLWLDLGAALTRPLACTACAPRGCCGPGSTPAARHSPESDPTPGAVPWVGTTFRAAAADWKLSHRRGRAITLV